MKKLPSLVLPVLIPSWRFFKAIEPSPRIQWGLFAPDGTISRDWEEFRPQPETLTFGEILGRLFWNPARNEVLFTLTCAERISRSPTAHSIKEIQRRILEDIIEKQLDTQDSSLQFRLIFMEEDSAEILYHSPFLPLEKEALHEL